MTSAPVLGIDFGTTNSVCSILSGGDPEFLRNEEGDFLTPSVVYYTKDNEQYQPLIGQPAVNKAEQDPQRVIRSIKRKMGDEEIINVDGESYRVEEVSGSILRKIRTDAAEKLNVNRDELTESVITTPAYWESDRKQAVIQAAKLAGFERVRTIKEPASAAIAYGRFKPGMDKLVGVYDLGGGTFDFALVDVKVGDDTTGGEYNVIAQFGDPELGGDDWDERIVEWIVNGFENRTGVDPRERHQSDESEFDHIIRGERLRKEAKQAKEELSNHMVDSVNIELPFFMSFQGTQYDISRELTQTKFESLTQNLLDRTRDPILQTLDDAGVSTHAIDDIILVGGSTRMPQVKQLVQSIFEKTPKDDVDPDKVVAAGAAIKGNRDDILLLEVTPLSLGIGLNGDRFKRMIPRNTRLPARETEVFTTSSTGATSVRIPIYQGEREIASENRHLKTLIIQGMTPGNRQSAHIEVTFEVQPNGLINVNAVESTRNKNVNVEIEGENRLSDEYVKEKIQEAQEMEELDHKRKQIIDAQNEAKDSIEEAERLLTEFPHIIEDEEMKTVEKHIANVRQIRHDETATLGDLREATDSLNQWVLEIGDRARKKGTKPKSLPQENVSRDVDIDSGGPQKANTPSQTRDKATNVNELEDITTGGGNSEPTSQDTTTQQTEQVNGTQDNSSTDEEDSGIYEWDGVNEETDDTGSSTSNKEREDSKTHEKDTTQVAVDEDEDALDMFVGDAKLNDEGESVNDGTIDKSVDEEETQDDDIDSEDNKQTTDDNINVEQVSTEKETDLVGEHLQQETDNSESNSTENDENQSIPTNDISEDSEEKSTDDIHSKKSDSQKGETENDKEHDEKKEDDPPEQATINDIDGKVDF